MPSMWKFGGLRWRQLLRELWQQFWKDHILDQAAMLAFYFILAVFPLLLFLVAVLGLMLQSDQAVHQAIREYLTRIAPGSASGLIDTTLQQIRQGSTGEALSIGLLFSLWVASSGMVAIMEALNIAYEAKESRPWWRQRLVALGLTLGLILFLAAALILLGYGDRLAEWAAGRLGNRSGWAVTGWRILKWLVVVGLLLMGFNLLYFFAPNVKHRQWHWLMPGTVLGVGLWLLVSYGFKVYLTFFNTYNVTYGSIAAVIVLLLWFYLTAIAILMGGELNSEIEKRTGQVAERSAGK
ncbi:MAG TPA: YihY/virulence factor BrkB family protein [Candidatus Sulfotelmatobacter sp.]|nr:YihY/virulence factor BrkB family protein [Candidatus Sulfotelmatobacter sp.]